MTTQTPPDGEAILKEVVDGLKGVTPGPWIKSGVQSNISEKCASAGPDNGKGMMFFAPLGKTHKETACAILDMKHIARCSPDKIRSIAAHVATLTAERDIQAEANVIACQRVRELEAERDAARAALEHDRSLVCDQYREIETVIQGYAWVLEGRGSYAWDDDKYRDEFKNVSSALNAALEPVKAVVKDWSNCPTDHQAITEARRDVEVERDTADARVKVLSEILSEQTALTDRLLTIVESIDSNIGHESPDAIWPLLGPVCDRARAALKEQS